MAANQQTMEVMAAFQRYVKSQDLSEVEGYSLKDLLHADESLGNRDINASFRIALRNRIKALEDKNEKNYQSIVRAFSYVVAFAAGVLTTLLADWLTK